MDFFQQFMSPFDTDEARKMRSMGLGGSVPNSDLSDLYSARDYSSGMQNYGQLIQLLQMLMGYSGQQGAQFARGQQGMAMRNPAGMMSDFERRGPVPGQPSPRYFPSTPRISQFSPANNFAGTATTPGQNPGFVGAPYGGGKPLMNDLVNRSPMPFEDYFRTISGVGPSY